MGKITVNGGKEFDLPAGRSLLVGLKGQSIFIPSACGGRGLCGLCKVKITQGAPPPSPADLEHLSPQEIENQMRLACQVKSHDDLAVELPAEILGVREYATTVTSIRELTYDVREITFTLREGETMAFKAGQYVQLTTPVYGSLTRPVYRAYSIASEPQRSGEIVLVIRRAPEGICSTWVFDILSKGDRARLNGPYGQFALRDTDAEIIMVAGSTGLAPIYSILRDMRNNPRALARRCRFFFGGSTPRDMFYLDECRRLEKDYPNFQFIPCARSCDSGEVWNGEMGLVTEVIDRHVQSAVQAEGYLCGSPGMIDAAVKVLKAKGMPEEGIYYDKFA